MSPLRQFARVTLGAIAVVYFVIDAIFLGLFRPLYEWLKTFNPWTKFLDRVEKLPRYPSLIVLAVPVVVLEPVKPIGFYWLSQGHISRAVALLVIGEILKVTIIHSLFHRVKPKLLTIEWFAWCDLRVMRFLNYLTALPAYVSAKEIFLSAKAISERLFIAIKTKLKAAFSDAK